MPVVVIGPELARRFTSGATRIELNEPAATVRALVRALDDHYPGLGEILSGDEMAIAIDGQIYQGALLQALNPNSEICFMPAIEGG